MASVMDEETERERKELFEEVDGLHPQKAYQEIFDKVSSYLQKHKDARENDVEVLWRLARAYFDLAFEFEQKKQKERYVSQGRAVAEHMLRRFPEHAVSHKWFAILVSAHGEFLSLRRKIEEGYLVKQHAETAVELNPQDSTTLHLLGRWCFTVADVSWIERKFASTIISEPPDATFKDALKYFKRAHKIKPDYIGNALWIAHTYKKLGNRREADKWYRKAITMSPLCEADKLLITESKKALARL